MNWVDWVGLALTIVLLGLVVHGWLLWRLWGKLKAVARELSVVLDEVSELGTRVGELGLTPDQAEPTARATAESTSRDPSRL